MQTASLTTSPASVPQAAEPIDIVILANGPGEVATWVKPVVQALRSKIANAKIANAKTAEAEGTVEGAVERAIGNADLAESNPSYRISVILSPCPHASGKEPLILSRYPEVDRVQSAPHFFKFLLTGATADQWDWHSKGVVVFLGGDQLYTVLVAKRLGYRSVTYAEWDARWPQWIDHFGVMKDTLIRTAPSAHRHKFTHVGDLMADVQTTADRDAIFQTLGYAPTNDLIGFLPGSKPAKLNVGVPMMLAIAQILHRHQPNAQYVAGVAPNLTLADLMGYADPEQNRAAPLFNPPDAKLVEPDDALPYIQIENGPKIVLWQTFPALDLFSQCKLCFTTVGANTAQLGALAIPMIVLLPTQNLGALQLADGWPGLVSRLPGIGSLVRKVINPLIIRALQKANKRFAWPNIWAKREVVPELFGHVTADDVCAIALDYLTHPEKLNTVRQTLRDLRGPAGAAEKMADIILKTAHHPK
ncbi:MAG: lipid-A-disaccharide synthase [Cyanobacteria bacterium J06632_3]